MGAVGWFGEEEDGPEGESSVGGLLIGVVVGMVEPGDVTGVSDGMVVGIVVSGDGTGVG